MLHAYAASPCRRFLAACPSCISMLRVLAACPYCMTMLHVILHVLAMLHVHAASPWCMSIFGMAWKKRPDVISSEGYLQYIQYIREHYDWLNEKIASFHWCRGQQCCLLYSYFKNTTDIYLLRLVVVGNGDNRIAQSTYWLYGTGGEDNS
jgi:hypothetical protein